MRRAVPLALAATLAAPVTAATPDQAAMFLDAMRDAGCEMSFDDADDTAEALGIDVEDLDDIIDLLFVGGMLGIDANDHMTMIPTLCTGDLDPDADLFARLQDEIDLDAAVEPFFGAPPSVDAAPTPERGALLLAALRGNDCVVQRDDTDALLTASGLTPVEAETAIVVLFEAGHMRFAGGPDVLSLSDAICTADPSSDAAFFETAAAQVIGTGQPVDPDIVLAERFGPDGIHAVLEFLADASDCTLDTSNRAEMVDGVAAFMAYNVTGEYNLPADFSPGAEAELRALIDAMLDDPGPAFEAAPGQLTLIDCTP